MNRIISQPLFALRTCPRNKKHRNLVFEIVLHQILNGTHETVAMDNFTSSMDPMMTLLQFSWVDYTLFVLMFGVSAAIGVYFGFFDRQDKTAEDYLLGGREMNIFPIAMSLVAR